MNTRTKNHISLEGIDGNAFSIISFVRKHMKQASYSTEEIEEYTKSAKSDDYINLVLVSELQIASINERIKELQK